MNLILAGCGVGCCGRGVQGVLKMRGIEVSLLQIEVLWWATRVDQFSGCLLPSNATAGIAVRVC